MGHSPPNGAGAAVGDEAGCSGDCGEPGRGVGAVVGDEAGCSGDCGEPGRGAGAAVGDDTGCSGDCGEPGRGAGAPVGDEVGVGVGMKVCSKVKFTKNVVCCARLRCLVWRARRRRGWEPLDETTMEIVWSPASKKRG